MWQSYVKRTRKGFTLVELAVVIVIIGVLAAFGVPKFLKSVEKSKASEAFAYLAAVRASQERFIAQNGVYYAGTADVGTGIFPPVNGVSLDINQSLPKYFDLGEITAEAVTNGVPKWSMTLTRNGTSSYTYTVIFNQDGFDTVSTILNDTNKDISPLSGTWTGTPP